MLELDDPFHPLILLGLELHDPLVAGRKILFELADPVEALVKLALELPRQDSMMFLGLLDLCYVTSEELQLDDGAPKAPIRVDAHRLSRGVRSGIGRYVPGA